MTLFSAADLSGILRYTVDPTLAARAEIMVRGWLMSAGVDLDSLPDPLPPDLYSAALELGILLVDNPANRARKMVGNELLIFDVTRRDAILEGVRLSPDGGLAQTKPRGQFPPAVSWPDPAIAPYGTLYVSPY